jgi:hypothetical protein
LNAEFASSKFGTGQANHGTIMMTLKKTIADWLKNAIRPLGLS